MTMKATPSRADRRRRLRARKKGLKPPPNLTLSQWANRYYRMSAVSSAAPGRWRTIPYQRDILDAITDRRVEFVSFMKSARVGASKMLNISMGYHIHYDPCTAMLVQPTVDDARGYSQDEIQPMLDDIPELRDLVVQGAAAKKSGNTILRKSFPGGVLSLVGANSGTGFRRVSRRLVLLDEVDGYPASAGNEGDPVSLAIKRSAFYWNRKIFAVSTPKNAGSSRIEEMFLAGDQRRRHVPCPHCGYMDIFTFHERPDRGHYMSWENSDPATAHMVCRDCGSSIDYKYQQQMDERGEWRPDAKFKGHASFHIWSAYSIAPDVTWPKLVEKYLAVKDNPKTHQPFVNLELGEVWSEIGEAPDYDRLYLRREDYTIGSVPDGAEFLTCGADVHADRIVYDVVGWAFDKENWGIESGVLYGDTSKPEVWSLLEDLLYKDFPGSGGRTFNIRMMAVDSGYNTNEVYTWCRKFSMGHVVAVRGVPTALTLIGTTSAVDIKINGRKHAKGFRMWPVGVDVAKVEFYGWLRQDLPEEWTEGDPYPARWCHFPQYGLDYFKEITAETLVNVRNKKGFEVREWQQLAGRENHYLDCRVYARAAASILGLDRMRVDASVKKPARPKSEPPRVAEAKQERPAEEPRAEEPRKRKPSGWLAGGRSRVGGFLGGGRRGRR